MAIPDLNDRSLFPPFVDLPADDGDDGDDGQDGQDGRWLLAQIRDNMTITKPTLVLTDRDGHPFALVFDGLDRDGLDLGALGLKKGATAIVCNAHQSVPLGGNDDSGNDPASMTSQAAKRPFVRIAAGQAHTVRAVPGGLEQTLAAAGKLRNKLAAETQRCDACGSTGHGAKLLGCTGCSQAHYCDRTRGWSDGHKGECKAWRALTTIWPIGECRTGYTL